MVDLIKSALSPITIFDLSGQSLTNGSVSTFTNTPLTDANTGGFWLCTFDLTVTASGAMTQDSIISLYERLLNIDGTADEPAPSLTHEYTFVGSFPMPAATTASKRLRSIALPDLKNGESAEYQIKNESGQTLTDIKLVCKPITGATSA